MDAREKQIRNSFMRISNSPSISIKVEPPPALAPLVASSGFQEGIKQFDQAMHEWANNLTRTIAETISQNVTK